MGVNVARHRRVDAEELDRVAPGLEHRGGGPRLPRVCDRRRAPHARDRPRSREHGALVANHARVEGLLGEGRVTGAIVRDELSGETAEIRRKTTVNATGVWSEQLQSLATDTPRRHGPRAGIHLVFRPGRRARPRGPARPVGRGRPPLRVRDPVDGPLLRRHDRHRVPGDLEAPAVEQTDVDYVLGAVGALPVPRRRTRGAWSPRGQASGRWRTAGDGPTADLSRRHRSTRSRPACSRSPAASWTTYRAMAEDVVDRIAPRTKSRTRELPLGLTMPLTEALARRARRCCGRAVRGQGRRFVHRYGDDWQDAVALIAAAGARGAGRRRRPALEVDRELARTREMALTDADVNERRLRLTTLGVTAAARLG